MQEKKCKYQCISCSNIWDQEMEKSISHFNGKYMGPCAWHVECICGSMYMKWLNFEDFKI